MENNPGINLDGLDFEAIDKEIIVDKAPTAGAAVVGAAVVAVVEAIDGATKVATDDIPGVDEDNVVVGDKSSLCLMCIFCLDVPFVLGLCFEQSASILHMHMWGSSFLC